MTRGPLSSAVVRGSGRRPQGGSVLPRWLREPLPAPALGEPPIIATLVGVPEPPVHDELLIPGLS